MITRSNGYDKCSESGLLGTPSSEIVTQDANGKAVLLSGDATPINRGAVFAGLAYVSNDQSKVSIIGLNGESIEISQSDTSIEAIIKQINNGWLMSAQMTADAGTHGNVNVETHQVLIRQKNGDTGTRSGIDVRDGAIFMISDSGGAGVVFPNMTAAEVAAIASPQLGAVQFNTTDDKLQVYTSTGWENLH